VLGAIDMLGLAKRLHARILQASISEVYGDPDVHPQTEDYCGLVNMAGPRACYDEGKRCTETLFHDYRRQHWLDIRIARIFNTYGRTCMLMVAAALAIAAAGMLAHRAEAGLSGLIWMLVLTVPFVLQREFSRGSLCGCRERSRSHRHLETSSLRRDRWRQCMGSMKRPGYPPFGRLEPAGADEELVVTSFEVVTLLHKPRPKRSPVRRRIRYLVDDDEHASQTRS
jgi:GDP-mannose 4,6 dehydratase